MTTRSRPEGAGTRAPFASFVHTPVHGPAFDALVATLAAHRRAPGLMLISGAPGTGKTALCGALHDRLDRSPHYAVGLIADAAAERGDVRLLRGMTAALGHAPSGRTGLDVLTELRALVATLDAEGGTGDEGGEERRTVLLIDNAQALGGSQLEILRSLLGHPDASTAAGPTPAPGPALVLFARPELRDRIARRRGLAGRLVADLTLAPLDRDGLAALLESHALPGGPPFSAAALDALTTASGGIPDRALPLAAAARQAALGRGWEQVDERLVAAAVAVAGSPVTVVPATSGDATQARLPFADAADAADAADGGGRLPRVSTAQLELLGLPAGEESGT